jgi:hypothetical protein
MPNHVTNRLCITGPKKDRDAFLATLNKPGYGDRKVGEFCFHQIVPMPSTVRRGNMSFDEMQKDPNNWYDWSIANWGTKWPNYKTSPPEIGSKSIKLVFQTAWNPPREWMYTASKAFPTLKFCNHYAIEGNGKGVSTMRAGEPA